MLFTALRFRAARSTLAAALLLALAPFPHGAVAQDEPETLAPPAQPGTAPAGSVGGLGDVNLFPKRVVLDGPRQIASIGLYNKTANEGEYEIRLIDMGMTTEGRLIAFDNGLSEADRAKVRTASGILRYSPRRVTLRSNEAQTIRIMARAGNDLPPGEYRSHFMVISVPRDAAEGFSIENAVQPSGGPDIGVTIRPRFGISIPVIVRIGATTLDVGITNARLLTARDGSQAVAFTITRAGTRSAFGDIAVTAKGARDPLVIAKGIGVYPEIDQREIVLPVEREPGTPAIAAGTTITISYVDDDAEPGKSLAEHSFVVP